MNCDRLGTLKRTEQQEKIKGPRLTPLGFVISAIRSGLLGRDVLHDTLKPYTRRALNQIAAHNR
nr:MAG TPA: hypothetical protein [Caudoviricetes sp.]